MARNEDLRITTTVADQASAKLGEIADDVRRIEGEHEVEVTAEDRASDELRKITDRLDNLTDEQKTVVLTARAQGLENEIRKAERGLRNVQNLSDEEVAIRVTARDNATAELDAIRRELAKLDGETASPNVDVDTNAAEGFGADFGNKLIGGFAAVGVGAAMGALIAERFEVRAAVGRTIAQFELTKDEADRLSQIGADLYAQNWGNSVDEVVGALAEVDRTIGATRRLTERELREITIAALGVADVFGFDVAEVIRAVGQLLTNELAGTGSEALDILTAALQGGADRAQDLLDTIEEYAPAFEAVGLDGRDAMAILIRGIDEGVRNTDYLGDAIKELRIRAVEDTDAITDAYDELGLNADDIRTKFLEGGTAAREAYDLVLTALASVQDPVRQNALAVELIGTKFEDIGPIALEVLRATGDELGNVQDRAQDAADASADMASPIERIGRRALDAANIGFTPLADTFDKVAGGADIVGEAFGRMFDSGPSEKVTDLADRLAVDLLNATDAAAEGLADGLADAARRAADGSSDAAEEARQLRIAARAAADDGVGPLTHELDDTADAAERATDKVSEFKDEIDDRETYLDARDAIGELGAAVADTGVDFDDLKTAGGDIERQLLRTKRETLSYIESLGNVPSAVTTQIMAALDRGEFDRAQQLLDQLDDDRFVNYIPVVQPARVPGASRYSHVGSRATPGEVIETIPGQTFIPDVPGRIESIEDGRRRTAAATTAAGSGDGPMTVMMPVTVNAGLGADGADIGRQLIEIISNFERFNGTAWRER